MRLLIDAQPQPAHDRAEVCDTLRIPGVHQGTVDAIADKDESRGIFITLNGISELISKPETWKCYATVQSRFVFLVRCLEAKLTQKSTLMFAGCFMD